MLEAWKTTKEICVLTGLIPHYFSRGLSCPFGAKSNGTKPSKWREHSRGHVPGTCTWKRSRVIVVRRDNSGAKTAYEKRGLVFFEPKEMDSDFIEPMESHVELRSENEIE